MLFTSYISKTGLWLTWNNNTWNPGLFPYYSPGDVAYKEREDAKPTKEQTKNKQTKQKMCGPVFYLIIYLFLFGPTAEQLQVPVLNCGWGTSPSS